MVYLLEGKQGKLIKGQKVTIPPWAHHTFWSDKDSEVGLDVTVTVHGGPNPGFDDDFGESMMDTAHEANLRFARCETQSATSVSPTIPNPGIVLKVRL